MKKIRNSFLAALFLSLALLLPAGVSAQKGDPAGETQAEEITQNCTLSATENTQALANLKDGTVTTVWKACAGASLTICSEKPIAGLYLSWDRDAVKWSLSAQRDGGTSFLTDGGDDGFLHEYVPLKEEEASLTLTFQQDAVLTDIAVFTPGPLPDWVQRWEPMLKKADMLVFSTHADDELLWFGGTLPTYAGEYKRKVQVAYLIYHGAARGEYFRCHELLDGLWTVGVRNYPMIWREFDDYYCSSLAQAEATYDVTAMQEYATMLLRRFRPEVVIAQDEKGEYGHGVHQLAVKVMKDAIGFSGDRQKFPQSVQEYGIWNIKKCYLHLYPENQIVMDWYRPLEAFGGKNGIEMAIEGYQCHKSQIKKWFRVEAEGSQYDCRKFGLYYTSVGPDVKKDDFLENIPPEDLVTTTPPTTAPPPTTTAEPTATTTAPPTTTRAPAVPVQGGVTSVPPGPPLSSGPAIWIVGIAAVLVVGGTAVLLCLFGFRRRGGKKPASRRFGRRKKRRKSR